MHTFFINTSGKSINGYEVLFDIHYENKTLVTMECPMTDWYNKEKGYAACVRQMGDMIDGYVELNNAFNLIIYIDLPEIKAYSAIERDALHDREREACCRAMHILYTHIVSGSIVAELNNSGRPPQNVLIMFGQEKIFADFGAAPSDPNRPEIMEKLFSLIGLPDAAEVVELAKQVSGGSAPEKVEEFKTKLLAACGGELVPGIREQYHTDLQLWYEEIIHDADIPDANEALFNRIGDINRAETGREGIAILSCPYDCYACRVNKSALALSELNLALYVLKCVLAESIYEIDPDTETGKLIPFRAYRVDEVAPLFKDKERFFASKASEIDSMAQSYAELGLAKRLKAFDHQLFGLDAYGDKEYDLVVVDIEKETDGEEPREETTEETVENTSDEPIVVTTHKEVVAERKNGGRLFTKEEFAPFDYTFEYDADKMLRRDAKPVQYIEQAKKMRKHHLDYLKKLKLHVFKALSNYAGKSKENKPALLRVGSERYARGEYETRVLEEVESVSNKAYDTMFDQYMEFCAGRSVAITDIEEQCNWFVSRIDQIDQSIRKIKTVAVGLFFAIVALYVPYAVLQFEAIIADVLTVVTGLCSVAIPIMLLYAVFTAMAIAQKRKYLQAWKEFKKESDEALRENAVAVQKYDHLLSTIIPALRWVYEYKLEADYCAECCSVADAKVEHHRRKLRDRVFAIQNILSDLEYRPEEEENRNQYTHVGDVIDYGTPFCTGKENKEFYTVINRAFFGNTGN